MTDLPATMKTIRVHEYGGPEKLSYDDVPLPNVGADEVLLRVNCAGVNFIDTYNRSGLYQLPTLPSSIGRDAAGVAVKVGENVEHVKEGDRVACALHIGSYGEYAVVPGWKVAGIPDGVDDKVAVAGMIQGMTALMLANDVYAVKKGDSVLVHAAAGGVGQLLVQLVANRGATVIATVSTEEKAEIARACGAKHVILYRKKNDAGEEVVEFAARVRELTNGEGVHVVYDGVGRSTFDQSLDSLRQRGLLAVFGNASGAPNPVAPNTLSTKGSLFLTRPTLFHYASTAESFAAYANETLRLLSTGEWTAHVKHTYSLKDAAQAHIDLEAGKTTGKIVLLP